MRSLTRWEGAAAAVALTLVLSGCGSSSADDAATGGASTTDAPSSSSSTSSAPAPPPSSESTSSTGAPTEAPSEAPAEATIMIKDFAFELSGTVEPGATITVTNMDTAAHTVTASGDGGFDVKIDGGKSATFTAPETAGSYPFVCTYHQSMKATLEVA